MLKATNTIEVHEKWSMSRCRNMFCGRTCPPIGIVINSSINRLTYPCASEAVSELTVLLVCQVGSRHTRIIQQDLNASYGL